MLKRTALLALTAAGLLNVSAFRCPAASPVQNLDDDEKGEQKVAIDQLPAAVVETVKKELPDGKITDAETEQKHGKTVYEIDVKSGDIAYEIKTGEDGSFISKKIDDDKDEQHGEKK